MRITAKTPWAEHLGEVPLTLDYFEGTMYEAVCRIARQYPRYTALDFMGRSVSYEALLLKINETAEALISAGIHAGDAVTIAMPNCPQAVYLFYAVNLAGAVGNMVHPLSAEKEIEFYLKESASVAVFTLDIFYEKMAAAASAVGGVKLIAGSLADEMSPALRLGYRLKEGRKLPKLPPKNEDGSFQTWRQFLRAGRLGDASFPGEGESARPDPEGRSAAPAVILYSGGTTGTTKGIVLTNRNFNALGQQVIAANPMFRPGDKMLSAMPLFHGFGLGVCIHSMLASGGRCVLIPRFSPGTCAKALIRSRCQFIAGVPTLYAALLRAPGMEKADLSFLKGVFSGGDSLSIDAKQRIDHFLREHRSAVQVREGYGTTETVTACCLTPPHMYKEGSIGLPFPDTYIKIVEPGTDHELPFGDEGEILLAGPTVMKEYLHNGEETAACLRTHADGLTWVYTGDLGYMDAEGFLFFRGRRKRMIVSSGYNIYPGRIEEILDSHEKVAMSCVIGVPDPYRIEKPKAFVVLQDNVPKSEETKEELLAWCRRHIARYALPAELVFLDELPKTPVGKVNYRMLEETAVGESGGR